MVIILYFMFQVYAGDELIGSPSKMFELLKKAANLRPVEGNLDGSYVTLKYDLANSISMSLVLELIELPDRTMLSYLE